jgi:mRNA-degrading endonuclease HigB of HigAB toxin-antitoxin module
VQVIGLGQLTAFADQHPDCAGTIWALHALVAASEWRSAEDAVAHLGGLVQSVCEGLVVIETQSTPRIRLMLQVNFSLGLVRVHYVEAVPNEDRS